MEQKETVNVEFIGVARVYVDSLQSKQEMEIEASNKMLQLLEESFSDVNTAVLLRHRISNAEVEFREIMNDRNAHNPQLVKDINNAWAYSWINRKRMAEIIEVLMKRDEEECEEKEVNGDLYEYLMHVADDTDLECILTYIHYYDKRD